MEEISELTLIARLPGLQPGNFFLVIPKIFCRFAPEQKDKIMAITKYFRVKRTNLKNELLNFFKSKDELKHTYYFPTSINYNEEAVIIGICLYPDNEPVFIEEDDILYRFSQCSVDFLCLMADRLSQHI